MVKLLVILLVVVCLSPVMDTLLLLVQLEMIMKMAIIHFHLCLVILHKLYFQVPKAPSAAPTSTTSPSPSAQPGTFLLCGPDPNKFYGGQTIYYSDKDNTDGKKKCWKIEVFEVGQVAVDATDPKCDNTSNFKATAVYSTFRRIGQGPRNSKIVMKSSDRDLGYNGVFIVKDNLGIVGVKHRVVDWNGDTKIFTMMLRFPPCDLIV
jgi:hypothetical protein